MVVNFRWHISRVDVVDSGWTCENVTAVPLAHRLTKHALIYRTLYRSSRGSLRAVEADPGRAKVQRQANCYPVKGGKARSSHVEQ